MNDTLKHSLQKIEFHINSIPDDEFIILCNNINTSVENTYNSIPKEPINIDNPDLLEYILGISE